MKSIQQTLGVADQAKSGLGQYTNDANAMKRKEKPGIDVVLGSQWGGKGKGKLVDMLSQVSFNCSSLFVGRGGEGGTC